MLHKIIEIKKNEWLQSYDCKIKYLLKYIRDKHDLREPQIAAIETYFFLKLAGENKPLWQLFSEGFFSFTTDLTTLNINQHARKYLSKNRAALSLFDFARQKNGNGNLLPDLERLIVESPEEIIYGAIIKSFFYDVRYSDYLFSLPMGAGKTFLMAAIIYLDLYFALNEPENKHFAHNFIVLVPSGLKSSIVPSLKTIEKFDPAWVLPEPTASRIKGMIRFEVLDQSKSAKRSNRARNPNAQKVNQYVSDPDLMGLVLVVNAEKIILDRLELSEQQELIEHTEDEKDKRANELRNLIGKIPNLQIVIDEVHHAATDDIKLRQVVNRWNDNGNVTTVLGFSGTPYLSSPDKITIDETTSIKFSQITNTVYYFPLTAGIQTFLKKPSVKIADMIDPLHIIEKGVEDFYLLYRNKIYEHGVIPKLAIYCGTIHRLENDIYPFVAQLVKKHGESEDVILKFHKGNKEFKLPKQNELEFNSLDTALSKKRIVLLVQIGKEGWDCRSLTGVILAQKGDCPTNMVLQTSCRCLRQVDKGKNESALIWLNDMNAQTLNKQLKSEQQTSIQQINHLSKLSGEEFVPRFSRMDHLQLPSVDFYQMKINYLTIDEEADPSTEKKLKGLSDKLGEFHQDKFITTRHNFIVAEDKTQIYSYGNEGANFSEWLLDISKESFDSIALRQLQPYSSLLQSIFETITYAKDDFRFFNEVYLHNAIKTKIRVAFNAKRSLDTTSETVKHDAQLLLVEKLLPVEKSQKLFPNDRDVQKIIELDTSGKTTEVDVAQLSKAYEVLRKQLEASGMGDFIPTFEQYKTPFDYSQAVRSKEMTLHYLPYNFFQSGFEKNVLEETLILHEFKSRNLEIYYNGERALTQFQIDCFALNGKRWKPVGKYTPDFLLVQRKKRHQLHKILILETKGRVFGNDPQFIRRKNYVSSEFLRLNEEKFGYKRFGFLVLSDEHELNRNLSTLNKTILEFFTE